MVKLNGQFVEPSYFPDGTLNLHPSDLSCQDAHIEWFYESDVEFMIVAYLAKFYKRRGCCVTFYLPYLPNARMDRIKFNDEVFSLKFFAELINSLEFDEVAVLDPHSAVSEALINNLCVLKSDRMFDDAYHDVSTFHGESPIVIYPDEGAMKRYTSGGRFVYPYGFGIKHRDWKTGKIQSLEIFGVSADQLQGKPVIIRDDICSYGGTFYYTAKKLKEMGAGDIYLFVTHCEQNVYYGDFDGYPLLSTGLIKHLYTTNSIYHLPEDNKVTIYNASEV